MRKDTLMGGQEALAGALGADSPFPNLCFPEHIFKAQPPSPCPWPGHQPPCSLPPLSKSKWSAIVLGAQGPSLDLPDSGQNPRQGPPLPSWLPHRTPQSRRAPALPGAVGQTTTSQPAARRQREVLFPQVASFWYLASCKLCLGMGN